MNIINCPTCGCRVSAGEKICPECGEDLSVFGTQDIKNNKGKRKGKRIGIIIAIFLCVALCSFAFLLVNARKDNNKDNDKEKLLENDNDESDINPIGVYSGDDHEILVIAEDNLAYYYCSATEYIELQCPWTREDDKIYIELAKLHCTIEAELANEQELIFKSESQNWNTEVFSKLDLDANDYIGRKVKANDQYLTVNEDGSMSFQLGTFDFLIPKNFIDYPDETDKMKNAYIFVDQDAERDYMAGILIYLNDINSLNGLDDKTIKKQALVYAKSFMNDVKISNPVKVDIQGVDGNVYEIKGNLNNNFYTMLGYEMNGKVIMAVDESQGKILQIIMIQTDNRKYDDSEIFNKIIGSESLF